MSDALLGASFDIHGGGIDLQFPHHENELAQSSCAHPGARFAQVWMHNEMLQVEGRKMSKSLGNFFTVRDLLDQGVPGEVIRFVLLGTHYAKPMDWTREKAEQAEATLRKWRGLVAGIDPAPAPLPSVIAALADDLNTAGAIAALHEAAGQGDGAGLKASAALLGLLEDGMGDWALAPAQGDASRRVQELMLARAEARATRDWARADAIRKGLDAAGVVVQDRPDGSFEVSFAPGFDPAKLEVLQ